MKNKVAQNKLVEVHGKKLTTTSLVIAEHCGIQHKNALAIIRKYQNEFEEFGRVAFETRPFETKGGIQEQEIAILNEEQSAYLITMFRNNDIVRAFKLSLVKEFSRIKKLLNEAGRDEAIKDKRAEHSFMMEGLLFARDLQGKETKSHHYINENLFCNRALTGKWEALDETALDSYESKLLKAIRHHNTILIQHNLTQNERKEALDKFVEKYKAKKPHLRVLK